MRRTAAGVLAAALLAGPTVGSAELITNGGFETGNLFGWSCVDADLCEANSTFVQSGSFSLWGFDNDGFATLSQIISTVAGGSYKLSFWSMAAADAAGNILRYQVDGGSIAEVLRTTAFAQTSGSFTAGGASTSINFFFETDPGTLVWAIDDVSVTAAVPEPGTLALLGLGLVGCAILRRRI